MNIGFDQHDLDHMSEGFGLHRPKVEISYRVIGPDGEVWHETDLTADGPDLAEALRPYAAEVTP